MRLASNAQAMAKYTNIIGILILPQLTQAFFFHWKKTTSLPTSSTIRSKNANKIDLEVLIGNNSTWCAYAYNHTFPDEYEMEYIKIKLCTNSSDADRIDAALRFQQIVEERGKIDQLMTHIIAKLANYDEEKIALLTANPLEVPLASTNNTCYDDTIEAFSRVCMDFELNPYVNRFQNVFLHACEVDWINPKSKIEAVFAEVCPSKTEPSTPTISEEKLENKANTIRSMNLSMYEDRPSDVVQGINSSSYYNAFLAMTSEDYVFETLKEQTRSGDGSTDPQLVEARAAFKLVSKKRQFVNQLITQLLTLLSEYDGEKKAMLTDDNYKIRDENMKCYMTVLEDFTKLCLDPQLNPYAKRFRKIFAHICEAEWLCVSKVRKIFSETCQLTEKKNTAIISGTF